RSCGLFYDYGYSTYSEYRYLLYDRISGRGMIDTAGLADGRKSIFGAVVMDAAFNESSVRLPVIIEKPLAVPSKRRPVLIEKGEACVFSDLSGICSADIPEKAAVYNEAAEILSAGQPLRTEELVPVSEIYEMLPSDCALVKKFTVRLRGKNDRAAGIYSIDRDGRYRYEYSWYDKGTESFAAAVYRFRRYCIMRDILPPKISCPAQAVPGEILFVGIKDGGSEVNCSTVAVEVDGRKVEWYFDMDNDAAAILPHNDIFAEGEHSVTVSAEDYAGNSAGAVRCTYRVRKGR
ncbi:MAG: hypothetical protein ACRCUT_05445, partial [Spirochaetota bacterium]